MYAVLPIQSFRLKMLSLFEIAIEAFHNCALVLSWSVCIYGRVALWLYLCVLIMPTTKKRYLVLLLRNAVKIYRFRCKFQLKILALLGF